MTSPETIRSPLRHLNPAEVGEEAQRESRNREVHVPPVSVYRWWARRTLSVNGALVRAFVRDHPGRNLILDPFAGGGMIPLAAVTEGQRVFAQDLNPWAAKGLRTMMTLPSYSAIADSADRLEKLSRDLIDKAYGTVMADGQPGVLAHSFRVSSSACSSCNTRIDHFPHAMVTMLERRERGTTACFLACPAGHVFRGESNGSQSCPTCDRVVDPSSNYTTRRLITCHGCGSTSSLKAADARQTWAWRLALVQRVGEGGRKEFDLPTPAEIEQAESGWMLHRDLGRVPVGQETGVLLRHGIEKWADIYPTRQAAVIEGLLGFLDEASDCASVRSALESVILGSTEMAGLLSRWDRWYLKSYESMSGHRFNFTTFAAEPNVWGVPGAGRGTILRRLAHLEKAASWLHHHAGPLSVAGPGAELQTHTGKLADVRVDCGSSEKLALRSRSVALCLTDPPYHDDVQYGELSLPFRAWAGLSVDQLTAEALVNEYTGQNADEGEYRELLTRIFGEVQRVLRTDGHLIFSYANRSPEAWCDLLQALQDAGFRAVGYTTVHSENETDSAKRNVRACTLDVILDLVPNGRRPVQRWKQRMDPPTTPEQEFVQVIGRYVLRVGNLKNGWRRALTRELEQSEFLARSPQIEG